MRGRPEQYKTYQILAPVQTHFRPASCEEVGCRGYVNGWVTRVLPGTPEYAQVIGLKGRYRFTGPVGQKDGTAVFTFEAGQPCFRRTQHRLPLEREPIYRVTSAGRTLIEHRDANGWVDDFATHQQTIADAIGRG